MRFLNLNWALAFNAVMRRRVTQLTGVAGRRIRLAFSLLTCSWALQEKVSRLPGRDPSCREELRNKVQPAKSGSEPKSVKLDLPARLPCPELGSDPNSAPTQLPRPPGRGS